MFQDRRGCAIEAIRKGDESLSFIDVPSLSAQQQLLKALNRIMHDYAQITVDPH